MLTAKFWQSVSKDGFTRTYLRAFRATKNAQYIGGHEGLVKCVGQDRFGNRYYEDLSVDHIHHRRWVEFADFTVTNHMTEDKLEPQWVGWLAGTYDDLPTENVNFVKHSYIKPIEFERRLFGPTVKLPQGYQHTHNFVDRNEFIKDQKIRKNAPWEILEHDVSAVCGVIGRK